MNRWPLGTGHERVSQQVTVLTAMLACGALTLDFLTGLEEGELSNLTAAAIRFEGITIYLLLFATAATLYRFDSAALRRLLPSPLADADMLARRDRRAGHDLRLGPALFGLLIGLTATPAAGWGGLIAWPLVASSAPDTLNVHAPGSSGQLIVASWLDRAAVIATNVTQLGLLLGAVVPASLLESGLPDDVARFEAIGPVSFGLAGWLVPIALFAITLGALGWRGRGRTHWRYRQTSNPLLRSLSLPALPWQAAKRPR